MNYELKKLDWETNFLRKLSAKLVLKNKIENKDIIEIKKQINKYKFITIENIANSEENNKRIYELGNVFLADVNIKFQKKVNNIQYKNKAIISNNQEYNKQIIDIAKTSFYNTRFMIDKNIKKGELVYKNWVENSFNKKDKYFSYYNIDNKIIGFALFNKTNKITLELIAVDKKYMNNGIGSILLSAIENYAYQNNINIIEVGTQLNNIKAQNFYIKNGFKHLTNNSIYHLWM